MDNELTALTTIFTEFYYWMTVVLMFLIHVGFCMYEVGASRYKHHQHTLMKNTLLIPLVTVTWFFFGWWIYWALPNGPGLATSIISGGTGLELGGDYGGNTLAAPTSAYMAINLGDHLMGVFLGCVPTIFMDSSFHRFRSSHRKNHNICIWYNGDCNWFCVLVD